LTESETTPEKGAASSGTEDEEKPPLIQALLAVGTAVTAVTGIVSGLAFTGLLQRFPRNHSTAATVAFTLVIAAAALWVIATVGRSPGGRLVKWALGLGVVLFALGLAITVATIFLTYSEDEKPTISLTFERPDALTANVKAQGLGSNDEVGIKVQGLRRNVNDDAGWERFTLYDSTVGPDADGKIDYSVNLPIAPGTYELVEVLASTNDSYPKCYLETEKGSEVPVGRLSLTKITKGPKTGCLIFTLPRLARVPELDARINDALDGLDLAVSAENAPYRVLFQVTSGSRRTRRLLARELLMPDNEGIVEFERHIAVPGTAHIICALATWYRSGDRYPPMRCPQKTDNETVWSLLHLDRVH
jgi:Flp pilus assembly pilin Flp